MFKSRALKVLFGKNFNFDKKSLFCRKVEIVFPAISEDDKERLMLYRGEDGIVLYLIKRIEKLEKKLENLSKNNK